MNKQISLSVALGITLLSACAGVEARPPTCTQPAGKWRNVRGSVLNIQHYNSSTGAVAGVYVSASGTLGSHPIVGWINTAPSQTEEPCKDCKTNHAEVITFAVRWANGGLSAWTGTCAANSQSAGLEQISALWHTTRPVTNFDWDHTLTGSDRFDPIE
jgi:hypothetical protein